MSIGIQVSRKNNDAFTENDKKLSFSSAFFMHAIGQTEWRETTSSEEKVHHSFDYIPLIIAFSEDPNNAGTWRWDGGLSLTGANRSLIKLAFADNKKVRYYALYQNI